MLGVRFWGLVAPLINSRPDFSGLLKTIGFPKAGSYTLLSEGTLAGGRLTSRDSCLTEDF